jgi:uncharacterized membrane protein
MAAATTERDATEGTGRRLARWLLILFYGVAGVAHLVVTDAMVKITPGWVPQPRAVVIVTGLCELAGAVGLATVRWRRAAGWALALYAVCVFPANVNHAIHDLSTGTGLGWGYHGLRLPLQPLIVWWALVAGDCLRRRRRG